VKREEKQEAEEVLTRLFSGATLTDVGDDFTSTYIRLKFKGKGGEPLVITVENEWELTPPRSFFTLMANHEVVTSISLGENYPHLIVCFSGGETLRANGIDSLYESWQAGTKTQDYLVVACPGGTLAIWVPENEQSL